MKHFWVFLFFFHQFAVASNDDEICRRPQAEQTDVLSCSKEFAIHSCQELTEQNIELKYINTCGQGERQKFESKSEHPILTACGKGLAHSFEALKRWVKKPYVWFKGWKPKNYQCIAQLSDRLESIHKDAEERYKSIKGQTKEYQKKIDQYMYTIGGSLVRACTAQAQLKTNFLNLPSRKEMADMFDYLFRSAHCLNAEGRSKMLCPAIAEVVAGSFTGPALGAFKGLASGAKAIVNANRKIAKAEDRMGKFKVTTRSIKEIASLEHQDDLLAFTNSAKMKSRLAKMDLDLDSLRHGMVDSDLGKLADVETRFFRNLNEDSIELMDTLKGTRSTNASKYIREILDEAGFGGKSLLNPNIPNDKLIAAFESNPGLRGYLHELPGLSQAIKDVNNGTIDVIQFKNRVKANLFHNGPNEGFWKVLSEKAIPGNLKKTGNENFFKGTVFEGSKYPGSLSPEGVVHTLVDRLSQGTRGGLDKIFKEIGGADLDKSLVNGSLTKPLGEVGFPGQKGVQVIEDLIVGNSQRTKSQLVALRSHVDGMSNLSAVQKTELMKMVDEGIERLEAQSIELSKMVRFHKNGDVRSINIEYIDESGKKVYKTITDESSSGDALQEIAKAFKAEERINGDPIRDFSIRNFKERKVINKLGFYAGLVCGSTGILVPRPTEGQKTDPNAAK